MENTSGVGVLDKATSILGALKAGPASLAGLQGGNRICVAAAERLSGLRGVVPVGTTLPMRADAAAQILLAWEEAERLHRALQGARFTATALSGVRRRGWAQSIGEREPGATSSPPPSAARPTGSWPLSLPQARSVRIVGPLHAAAGGGRVSATTSPDRPAGPPAEAPAQRYREVR
ncbi:hypothetical protein GCM10010502_70430 [Kitasatospora aureofaciens]|uniref:IclR-ED domain-containing protein n=1 Tax=Kitasatospora aureofaciens TaxID=1894 RepID=A0A8H9HZ78_KITAU|nr:hypothetical protein GCM10010502_70430 [Kitasatospora aureofaciens]